MLAAILSLNFLIEYLTASLRMATPLLFASSGEVLSERAGVLNIGLEGMMLTGAFAGALGALYTNDPGIGLLCALIGGGLMGLIHAFMSITLRADQIVSGFALNLFALGLTGFFFRAIFGVTKIQASVATFKELPIPLLSDIPLIGDVLFDQIILVYIALLLVPTLSFILFRTTWGLSILAVGEHPQAADTVGIRVNTVRYVATVLCGALAGMGGACLSLGQLGTFVENMTAGRGFISLAAVIFGNWRPMRILGACLLFGAVDALQIRLQAFDVPIPYQLLVTLPYLVTLIALTGLVGRVRGPAALAIPYPKDQG
ncbi:MAG: ABC transporter permease [Chloroflexi bacterium]|nr:ABC transporter permease [Chloroflexota bacterium]